MDIHIPTMLVMLSVAGMTLAVSVGWVARRVDDDGLLLWTGALVLHSATYTLFVLRGQIPDLLSILFANTLLSCSYAVFLMAIGQFQQRTIPRILLWGPPLVLACIFSFLMENITARFIVGGLIYAGQILLVLIALMSRRYAIAGRGKHLMFFGLIIVIVVLLIRVQDAMFGSSGTLSLMAETPIQILTFAVAFIALVMVSNGFVLMTKERADQRTRLLAMKDRLTGAWNRMHIEEQAKQEMARLQRYGYAVSLIMVDLDHFKLINDRFGHATGDQILKDFCSIAQGCIRMSDVFGRWGGEEFVVLLPNSELSSALHLAERMRSALEQHSFVGDLKVTASLGVAVCRPTDSLESWLYRADMALYRAKAGGRNRVEAELPESGESRVSHADAGFVELVWNSAYDSGNPQIDQQHRALFAHADKLLKEILSDRPKQEIGSLFSALLGEIRRHFADEDAVLEAVAYPDAGRHREIHQDLLARAEELADLFASDQLGAGELIHYFAYEVIARHMLIEDRKYFPVLACSPRTDARTS